MTLEDICTYIVDCAHKTAPITESGGYFAVGTPAMRGNVINYGEARPIDRDTFEAWTTRLRPRHGDLLLAREAPVGPVVRIPPEENVAPGQRTVLLRPNPSVVDTRFLYYYLISPARQSALLAKASGSTVPHLNVSDVRTFSTSGIPSLGVQRAVAEVLEALDDKIAANEKVGEISRNLARSIFSRASAAGGRVVIRDVAKLVTRGITPKYVESGGTTVLNQKCVRDQRIGFTSSRMTHESSVRAEKLLQRDDVLVNSTGAGTLGRIARWTSDDRTTVDSHITIVRFDSTLVDPVCAGFGLLQIEKEVEGLAEGSTGQTELRRDLLAGLEIDMPSRAEQSAVGAELSALDELSVGLLRESGRLAATRDELLPLLMSGKIRVREAEKVVEGVV